MHQLRKTGQAYTVMRVPGLPRPYSLDFAGGCNWHTISALRCMYLGASARLSAQSHAETEGGAEARTLLTSRFVAAGPLSLMTVTIP
jgi:hypothetical protein